jgi:hypothetical protein
VRGQQAKSALNIKQNVSALPSNYTHFASTVGFMITFIITTIAILALTALHCHFADYFISGHLAALLSILAFWTTTASLLIAIWTLRVAKSIKQARIDYVKQRQHTDKRKKISEYIENIDKSLNSGGNNLSSGYIESIQTLVTLITCTPQFKAQLATLKEKLNRVVANPRAPNLAELKIILEEISNIMEQEHAANQ